VGRAYVITRKENDMAWKQAQFITSRTNPDECGDFTYTYEVHGDEPKRVRPEPQPGTIVIIDGGGWVDVVESSHNLLLIGEYTGLKGAYKREELDGEHVLIRQNVGPMRWVSRETVVDCAYNADAGWYLARKETDE